MKDGEYHLDKGMKVLMFFTAKISGLVALGLVILLTTFTAYDFANLYVVLNDGMSRRAATVLKREDPEELNKFFTYDYLIRETFVYGNNYEDYVINDFDYELDIVDMWIWPWQKDIKVTVNENISEDSWEFSITQSYLDELEEEETDEDNDDANSEEKPVQPPKWDNGKKVIELVKIEGQWKIDKISDYKD